MDRADTAQSAPLLSREHSGTLHFGHEDFLRILDDVEAHDHGYPEKEHTIDDEEVFRIRELIKEKPKGR